MNSYVSMFKIGGIPILPPLMTDEIRHEMRTYRKLACDIESNLCKSKLEKLSKIPRPILSSEESTTDINHKEKYYNSSDEISRNLLSSSDDCFDDDTQSHEDELEYLKISNMMHKKLPQNNYSKKFENLSIAKSYSISVDPVVEQEKIKIIEVDKCNSIISDYDLIAHFRKAMSKSVPPPPCEPVELRPKLVRSNSYTLLTPSPLLMKHLESQGVPVQTKTSVSDVMIPNKTSCSKNTPTILKTPMKKNNTKSAIQKKQTPLSNLHKKSPYEIKLVPKNPVKLTPVKIVQTKSNPKIDVKPTFPRLHTAPANSGTYRTNNYKDLMTKFDVERKKKLDDLIQKQKEEQEKLKNDFNRQEELLLKQLKCVTVTNSTLINRNIEISDKINNNINSPSLDRNCNNFVSELEPVSQVLLQQYLDMAKQSTPTKVEQTNDNQNNIQSQKYIRSLFSNSKQKRDSNTLDPDDYRKESAATIVNSYARGYLVRRLFKTEHVQKIVQVIHDTLIFVLDLHEESKYSNDPNDIELKGRLLSQLSSACMQLHEVFFLTQLNERLEIIRKDRELMKMKMKKLSTSIKKDSIKKKKI